MEVDRRGFLKTAGAGVGAASLALNTAGSAQAAPLTEKEKLARLASNTWPIRYIFKSRTGFGRNPKNEAAKQKYGEITMLDFPKFTKEHFPGVTHMDLFSGLFGDVTDDSMYVSSAAQRGRRHARDAGVRPFEPVGKEMARQDGEHDEDHRHHLPARLQ